MKKREFSKLFIVVLMKNEIIYKYVITCLKHLLVRSKIQDYKLIYKIANETSKHFLLQKNFNLIFSYFYFE